MGFYIIALAALYSAISSYVMMVAAKQKPPEGWGNRAYSKSRFALWLNKRREGSRFLGPLRVDRFRLAGVIASLVVFGVSVVALIVDAVTKQALYAFLGKLTTIIVSLSLLMAPFLYETFLTIWWSIIGRNSVTNSQMKKLKKIMREIDKSDKEQ